LAYRLDIGSLRPARKSRDGRLIVDGAITRTGVFTYRNADGTERREYRSPEEVFHADALDSFSFAPVTNDHPLEFLTPKNAKRHTVGQCGESLRVDGSHAIATMAINDADAIASIEAGKVELSCGYTADVVMQAGVSPEGEHYDAIQTNIRGNHVAIVDVGRAGPTAKIRMDASDSAYQVNPSPTPTITTQVRADSMDPEKIAELQRENARLILDSAKAEVRADKAEAEAKAEKARADKAEGERDDLKAKADSADKPEDIEAKVNAMVELRCDAAKVLTDFDFKGKTEREIKVAVIEAISSAKLDADKSDDYVNARYDAALETAKATKKVAKGSDKAPDSRVDSEQDARAKMIERNKKLYTDAVATAQGAN